MSDLSCVKCGRHFDAASASCPECGQVRGEPNAEWPRALLPGAERWQRPLSHAVQHARTRAPEPIDHAALDDLFADGQIHDHEDDTEVTMLDDSEILEIEDIHAESPLLSQDMPLEEPIARAEAPTFSPAASLTPADSFAASMFAPVTVQAPSPSEAFSVAPVTARATVAEMEAMQVPVIAEPPVAEPRRIPLAERFSWSDVVAEDEPTSIGLPPAAPVEESVEAPPHEEPPTPTHASLFASAPKAAPIAPSALRDLLGDDLDTVLDVPHEHESAVSTAPTVNAAGAAFAETPFDDDAFDREPTTIGPLPTAEPEMVAETSVATPALTGEITRAKLAPLWQRACAGIVDLLPVAGVTALTLIALEPMLERAQVPMLPHSIDELARFWWALGPKVGFVAAAIFGTAFLYQVLSFVFMQGTVGDLLFGIVWITGRGRKPGVFRALWRGAWMVVSVLLFGGGFWFALLTRSKRPFYDWVSGLYPVKRDSCVAAEPPALAELPLAPA